MSDTDKSWPAPDKNEGGNSPNHGLAAQQGKNPEEPNKNTIDQDNPNDPNPKAVPHAVVNNSNEQSESGKDIGLVHSPVVSLNPTSGETAEGGDDEDYPIIDNANMWLRSDKVQTEFKYPFADLEVGQGFFVKNDAGQTTDQNVAKMRKQVHQYREEYSEIATDENGDEIRDMIIVETKKRTADGHIQLNGEGKPNVGANQPNPYMRIYPANFIVRAVVKDDELSEGGQKAESDGVLVIRAV